LSPFVRRGAASEQSLLPSTGPRVDPPVAQRIVPDNGAIVSSAKDSESNLATPVDKSVLAIAAPRRYRNSEHLRTIIKEPCLVCGLLAGPNVVEAPWRA
jgi:hypothetical protein